MQTGKKEACGSKYEVASFNIDTKLSIMACKGLLAYLLLLMLAGCNRDSAPPTPIPVPGVVAEDTSLAVVAGTPENEERRRTVVEATTPSATPLPPERLANARTLYRFGDYANARRELAILSENLPTKNSLFVESQLLLALAYREEGLYNEALTVLAPLAAEIDSESLSHLSSASSGLSDEEWTVALIQMLQAEMFDNLGRDGEALAAYSQFVDDYPWSTELVQGKRGTILLAQGQAGEAANAYRAAAATSTEASAIAFYQETVAQIELGLGRPAKAVEAYEAILDVAKRPAYRAQIQYKAGNAAEAAAKETSAIGYWLAATNESAQSNDAHSALVQLVNRDVDFNLYQRGLINLNTKVWFPAISAFQAYLDSVSPTDRLAGQAMLGLAQAHIGAGNYQEALTVVNNLIESYPTCTCIGQAWLEKALAQAWLGDGVSAHRTYRTFARELPDNSLAAEALWQSGMMAYREGSPLEAAADLLSLVDGFPESERAPLSLFLIGLGAYREGFWDQSALFFQRMVDGYPDNDSAAAAYWLGRSHHARAKNANASKQAELNQQAQAAWEQAVEAEPGEYYSVLAAIALAQERPNFANLLPDVVLIEPEKRGLDGDDGSREFMETWLDSWLKPASGTTGDEAEGSSSQPGSQNDKNVPLGELPDSILSDPNWLQGHFFLYLSRRGEALPILERLLNDNADNPRVLYALSLAYEQIGAYRLSLIAANNLVILSPANFVEESPLFVQRMIYPQRFAELVVQEAEKQDIDPAVFFSLIRQESLFEEGARSHAAAQGLAQIIPDTGSWVAERLGYANYSNELIYRPYINLWFGAYYLNWTRDFLDGNLISALVGYNAGPGNSQSWRKESGNDDPLFVEVLTFSEPRLYIHKITVNYYHYLRLYPPSNTP